jgi:hypothetical protein
VARAWRSRVAALAAGQAAVISLAYAAPLAFGGAFGTYAEDVVPVVLAGTLAYLVWSVATGRAGVPIGVPPAVRSHAPASVEVLPP